MGHTQILAIFTIFLPPKGELFWQKMKLAKFPCNFFEGPPKDHL
jgi:hypothetical protein